MSNTERRVESVTLNIDRDGLTGGLQISINANEVNPDGSNGGGHGFRLAGPKYAGASTNIYSIKIGYRERDEIREYLDLLPECEHPNWVYAHSSPTGVAGEPPPFAGSASCARCRTRRVAEQSEHDRQCGTQWTGGAVCPPGES